MDLVWQAGRVEIMKIHGAPITKKGDIGASWPRVFRFLESYHLSVRIHSRPLIEC